MKNKNIFWGLFFICAAALIITYRLGNFNGLGLPSLIFTILLVPIIVKSISKLNFFGILLPVSLLLIIFDKPLGIEQLTPWPVLVAAFFLSIGLELVFKSKKHYPYFGYHKEYKNAHETIDNIDDNEVDCAVTFGSGSKYLNSTSLKKAYFKCSFGALKVYFDNATLDPDGAEVFLDASFGGVELYIPQSWTVNMNMTAAVGGVDEKYKKHVSGGPVLTLSGHVSFGGVEIIYI